MAGQICILHGWSDSSKSFTGLRDFLGTQNFDVRQIWLGDYISLDDDVRIEDVGKRMQSVLQDAIGRGDLTPPFDLIVHSTGGLVAREWIASHYPNAANCPIKRLVMLAPANFGSRLASMGKSMIGRVAKGWNNWFQTGTEMLNALELGSPYQWALARRDLLDEAGSGDGPYGNGKVWPFVITGTSGYHDGLRRIVNENGSDGTVRAAAANLDAIGLTVDFSVDANVPTLRPWHRRAGAARFPLVVLASHDHSSIIDPLGRVDDHELGPLILQALRCDSDNEYAAIHASWNEISEATAASAGDASFAHQFMQLVTLVRDDHGNPVGDYFLEFFAPETAGSSKAVFFHREVLEHVHVNGLQSAMRCLFVDRSDLLEKYYPMMRDPTKRRLAVSLSAAAVGRNIRHFDKTKEGARGHVVVHDADVERRELLGARLHRNTTHLIEIIVPRHPIDKVFKISR